MKAIDPIQGLLIGRGGVAFFLWVFFFIVLFGGCDTKLTPDAIQASTVPHHTIPVQAEHVDASRSKLAILIVVSQQGKTIHTDLVHAPDILLYGLNI